MAGVARKMKAKTKFRKMYLKLPVKARRELVYRYWDKPMSLNVCYNEIMNDTWASLGILSDLGYEDD